MPKEPICSKCANKIELLTFDSNHEFTFMRGGLYQGTICDNCQSFFCFNCHNFLKEGYTCKSCGGSLRPLFAKYLK